jgi:shikimate 5-dehydrogenase
VAIALASVGVKPTVHARHEARAAAVASIAPGIETGPWPPEAGTWDLLVNCTPVGMHPRDEETPLPAHLLTGRIVYDLVYNPPTTRLLRDATAAGCQTIGGLEMLVAQAAEQFETWTGLSPETAVMQRAASQRLSEFTTDANYVI